MDTYCRAHVVTRRKEVVYHLPFSCGKTYVGQTGRCLNDRLRGIVQFLSPMAILQFIVTGALHPEVRPG